MEQANSDKRLINLLKARFTRRVKEPQAQKGTRFMDDQDARRIASLEARMNRMETMMEQLLTILSTSGSEMQRVNRMQTMVQELHDGRGIHTVGTADINLSAVTPPERPLNRAIQDALQAGDNLKAIKLYRELYGVSLQEAVGALKITHR